MPGAASILDGQDDAFELVPGTVDIKVALRVRTAYAAC